MVQSKKSKLLRMMDELITQFTHNKYILTQLIHYRHTIRNVLSEETIEKEVMKFITKYKDRLDSKDYSVFENTPISVEAKIIWDSLEQSNKIVLWRWINFICN